MRFQFYYEPASLQECLQVLSHYGRDAYPLAGGTDLVVKLRSGAVQPKAVIGLHRVSELAKLETTPDGSIEIGAMNTLRDVASCKLLEGAYDLIRQGAVHISSMQIRNVATIGGNACNASPSADSVPGLIACKAAVRIAGKNGERTLPLEDFFLGPSRSALCPGEIMVGFTIPPSPPDTYGSYRKYAIRGDTDIAIVGVAARLTLDSTGTVQEARIVMGAVGPTPLRARKAEALLMGQQISEELIQEVAIMAANESRPITDQRATMEYRREMIKVWTRYAVRDASGKLPGNQYHSHKAGG
jgi:CO/xanthine dehydrogenase FAD-binding subunit